MTVHNFSTTRKWVTPEQMERLLKANTKTMDMLCDEVEDVVTTHSKTLLIEKDDLDLRYQKKKNAAQSALLALRIQGILDQTYVEPSKEKGKAEATVAKLESQVTDAVERFRSRR